MGAWIEIKTSFKSLSISILVAPFMGAWIEIPISSSLALSLALSHPSWVRGLKFNRPVSTGVVSLSHPSWVRGLKLHLVVLDHHPYDVAPFMGAWIEITFLICLTAACIVAPFMGAWIEIILFRCSILISLRRTLHGCVD